MCGIVAYVGRGRCKDYVLEGLSRLEYRGYDSAGYVCLDEKRKHLCFVKKVGSVSALKDAANQLDYDGSIGMGHSRWATHGVVNEINAHPHFNCNKTLAVVHNGIVEGYSQLRAKLEKEGHDFYSATDTEAVAHLFASLLRFHKNPKNAAAALVKQVKGAFAFVFIMEEYPDQLVIVRRRSPLVVGIGTNEMFVASDVIAFGDKTDTVFFVPEESFAIVKENSIQAFDFSCKPLPINTQKINFTLNSVDKEGFDHYMLKEIYEQKRAIDRSINFCKVFGSDKEVFSEYQDRIWQQLGLTIEQVQSLKRLNLVAAGTSWHACRIAQFFFEDVCKIPTRVYLSSEFSYMPFFKEENSLFIFVSQSGETADTLEALRTVNAFDIPTVTITNVASSSMVRESGGFLPMQAGPEISVASTKAFSTQLAILYWLAHRVALCKELISVADMKKAEEDLSVVAEVLETTIESYKWEITQKLAPKYSKFDRFIFLGRHISYPFAMEAALKLKEISYIFAQCYPAGELKHGPIALIDDKIPVIMFSSLHDVIYQKLVSNAQEVKARKGHLITFAFEGQDDLIKISDFSFVIPKVAPNLTPLAMTGLMQFFIYQITKELGCPIDKPRNLAKSVTVE